jgi:hypothetical protein
MDERFRCGKLRLVAGDEQHLRDVGERIAVAFVEGKTARHLQQIADGDGLAQIARSTPLRHEVRVAERKLAVLHPEADQRIERGLGHRPADQRHVRIEARRVMLGDDQPSMHHDQRAGVAGMRRVRLGEGCHDGSVKRGLVDILRKRIEIDALALGPERVARGRERLGKQARRLGS